MLGAYFQLLGLAVLMGCGQAEFRTVTPRPKVSRVIKNASTEDAMMEKGLIETFTLEVAKGKVDILWLVDQSGSMSTETANVQRNLSQFFSSVDQKLDARFAVVANSRSGNAIRIPVQDERHLQIEQDVSSNNALEIAVSTLLPADAATQPPLNPALVTSGTVRRYPVQGSLRNFFRSDALPVIVVVTDDNARRVTELNFMELTKAAIGMEPKMYAWRGNKSLPAVEGQQCNVAADGVAYEALAQKTDGEVFNLCDPDWSASFTKLSEHIVSSAKNTFQISKPAKSLVSVTVGGKKIDLSKVVLSGQQVTLPKEELNTSASAKIEISYLPQ